LYTKGDAIIEAVYADLHIHTVYSSDSLIQPKTLVDKLVAHNYIKAAAVTDHDSVRGCKATMELASSYPDILIIPGVEITTPKGDMLVLGTKQLPPKPWEPENIVDYAKSVDGVSIIAHPFRLYGMGDFARNVKVDAIEVLNGGSSTSANNQAKELAKSMGLPGTAGSDAHQLSELFAVNCKIDAGLNLEEVLNSIRKGSISAQMTSSTIRF
jgi:predicted metal-dependent phosphoesterase TrpH